MSRSRLNNKSLFLLKFSIFRLFPNFVQRICAILGTSTTPTPQVSEKNKVRTRTGQPPPNSDEPFRLSDFECTFVKQVT